MAALKAAFYSGENCAYLARSYLLKIQENQYFQAYFAHRGNGI